MNRTPQLTNDARAVLLEAIMPGAEVLRAFIFLRGDLRRAQFDSGRARLKALQLLDGETEFLNAEGERIARQLQENEARLKEGVPFGEHEAAIKLCGGRATEDVQDGWRKCEIAGRQFFTNGHMLIQGDPPSDTPMQRHVSDTGIITTYYGAMAGNPQLVKPVAYTESQAWKRREKVVWFSDGSAMNGEIFNFIAGRFVVVRWMRSAERETLPGSRTSFPYPFNCYDRTGRVAIVQPYSLEAGETVLRLIDEAQRPQEAPPAPEPTPLRPFDGRSAVQLTFLDKAA